MSRSDGLLVADEWFAEFIDRLERDTRRSRRLWRERVVIPARVEVERAFEEKTEQLRRMIAHEREQWLAEQEQTA